MKKFSIETISLSKLYLFWTFSIIFGIIVALLISFILSSVFNINAIIYIILVFVFSYSFSKITNRYMYSNIIVYICQDKISFKNKKKVISFKIQDIKKYKIRNELTNYPFFRVETYDKSIFKFNCKSKSSPKFENLMSHFRSVMASYDGSHERKTP